MKYIHTDNAPEAIGPYSQAIEVGDLIYTSGQIPLDPKTGEIAGNDVSSQTKQVFENLKAVLNAAGCDFGSVIKSTVFLTNMSDFPILNEIYQSNMGDHKPARSTIEVAALPKGVSVEIEMIAKKK